jgi:endogenous inhibitor of DNA gyrase (YacG/DUF329 family)
MGHYGIVYIARNDKHPENVYKIGGSARDVNARMAELNRETATFGKFKSKAFFPVTDWEQAEAKCHRSLSEFREDKKEFFTAPYDQLLKTVRGICEEYTPEVYAQEPEENTAKSASKIVKLKANENTKVNIVTCPHCGSTNRFSATKSIAQAKCGICKKPLQAKPEKEFNPFWGVLILAAIFALFQVLGN